MKINKIFLMAGLAVMGLMTTSCSDDDDYQKGPEENSILTLDLLADVVIYPDGKIRILDLDELAEAFEKGLINEALLKTALHSLGNLMDAIYENSISALEAPIIKAISASQRNQ